MHNKSLLTFALPGQQWLFTARLHRHGGMYGLRRTGYPREDLMFGMVVTGQHPHAPEPYILPVTGTIHARAMYG